MTNTLRAFGVAASLLMGTVLAASAATTIDPQGNTTPPATTNGTMYSNTNGQTGVTTMTPATGTSTATDSSPAASATPHVDRGNSEGAGGGAGGSGH